MQGIIMKAVEYRLIILIDENYSLLSEFSIGLLYEAH